MSRGENIMWSSTSIPRISAASKSLYVNWMSSGDGSTLADGWLCAKITDAALSIKTSANTSRGWTIVFVMVPIETTLMFIISLAPERDVTIKCSDFWKSQE